jgi:hypothetical protein
MPCNVKLLRAQHDQHSPYLQNSAKLSFFSTLRQGMKEFVALSIRESMLRLQARNFIIPMGTISERRLCAYGS